MEPDISVICNPDKLTDKSCTGAPDWIIEIVNQYVFENAIPVCIYEDLTINIAELLS